MQKYRTHSISRARLSVVANAGLKVAELVDWSAPSHVTQLREEKLHNVILLVFIAMATETIYITIPSPHRVPSCTRPGFMMSAPGGVVKDLAIREPDPNLH